MEGFHRRIASATLLITHNNPYFRANHFKATKQDLKAFNLEFLSKSLDPDSNRVGLNLSLHLLRHMWQCLPMDLTSDENLQKLFSAILISNLAKDLEHVYNRVGGAP